MEWRWVTAAEVITQRPCLLRKVVVTPSQGSAEATIYDGEGTGDPVILTVALATANSIPVDLGEGIKTNRGLYVGNFTNITGVLVAWEQV